MIVISDALGALGLCPLHDRRHEHEIELEVAAQARRRAHNAASGDARFREDSRARAHQEDWFVWQEEAE